MNSREISKTGQSAKGELHNEVVGAVPFEIERWFQKKNPAVRVPISLSADGKWLAIAMHGLATEGSMNANPLPKEGDASETVSEEASGSEIWIVERETGEITRPFKNFVGSYGPVWSPAGAMLAFEVQDSPTRYPRVAAWSPEENLPRIYEEAACRCLRVIGFNAPCWTPDGKCLVFFRHRTEKLRPPRIVHTVLDESGHSVRSGEPERFSETLGVLDIESGAVRSLPVPDVARTWGFRLSHDGKRVAFLVEADRLQSDIVANWVRLTVTDLDSGDTQTIGTAQPDGWELSLSWSPDGRCISWRSSPSGAPERLFIAKLGADAFLAEAPLPDDMKEGHMLSGESGPPAPPLWAANSASFWVPGKNALLHFSVDGTRLPDIPLPAHGGIDWLDNAAPSSAAVSTQQAPATGEVYLVRPRGIERVNLGTKSVQIILSDVMITNEWKWMERAVDWKSHELFTIRRTGNSGWELLKTSLADGTTAQLALLSPGIGQIQYGETRSLTWKLVDGTVCSGTLLLPDGWKEGDKPPVVMDVYGDDRDCGHFNASNIYQASYIINPHLLGQRGYAFFKPDMPQTDAEPAASLAHSGDAAADALRASGVVDADCIGVIGQSYGGYTVLCLLTASSKFKAGIAANGLYDLVRIATEHDQSWFVEGGQGRMRTSLCDDPQRYIDNSPSYALEKVQTPLLVLQGSGDNGFGKDQSPSLFSALKRLNKAAELIVGTDMGHAPTSWSIEAQRELVPKLLAFLDKHLKSE